MGHPALRRATPNIDRLAEEGVKFTNAYTNCPVCNPSRASMWSGKYPHVYDCWNNHEGLSENAPTFRATLESAGYRTATVGPLDYTYGKHSIRDRVGSWTRAAHIRRPISRTTPPRVVDDGAANRRDWERVHEANDFLRDASDGASPFFLYLTTGLVHPPFTAERRHMALIDEEAIDIPPGLSSIDGSEHPAAAYARITKNCDKAFSEAIVREIRHIYFAMIAALDEMVGQVLKTLDELGRADDTFVIFCSDHGEMAGEQNQILKRTMYEASSHVPMIIRGPGVKCGESVETPVSLVDLYPTLLEMGHIDYSEYAARPGYADALDGESLLPQATGEVPRTRDWALCEYHGDRCATGTFMLRRGEWKYIAHIGYEPELFNLREDPWERSNLAEKRPDMVKEMDHILTSNFDCAGIDARAKIYDRENFTKWRDAQKAAGTYEDSMARIYSGFDRLCIEDIAPWRKEDEDKIVTWLAQRRKSDSG
jgi:arylsulfatase K